MNTIDSLGIQNVCFSLVNELEDNDYRIEEYKQQRLTRGFDDTELWNLDYTIASFILPRLKRFKEVTHGYPAHLTEEEWNNILDSMIHAFELKVKDEDFDTIDEDLKREEEIKSGLQLFAEYFQSLWD